MIEWKTGLAAMLIAFAASPAQAAEAAAALTAPVEQIELLPIAFGPEGLSGVGGERLRAELADAQFIALGEDHGFAGSPLLAEALAHDAAAVAARNGSGPLYHAIEVGPFSTAWARELLTERGVDDFGRALTGRPFAMPFLTNAEDARLALPFARADRLWGIDQEFLGAPSILLDTLTIPVGGGATISELARWRNQDTVALAAGKFGHVMLSAAKPADFADLRARFPGDAKAQALIDALAASARIYQLNNSEQYLQNNEERARLMRDTFLAAYRAAPAKAPAVLFKMGAYHMGRGTTPTAIYDIGSLLPGLAAANGKTSLHIAYVPLAGSVRIVKPSQGAFTAVQPYADESIGPILAAAGIAQDSLSETGHVLIPLAPLRHKLQGKALRELPTFSRFLLLGYDYLVTTRDAQPATHFEAAGTK